MLAWMDLEMTGLDPTSDVIVEIATLITDDDLEIIAEGPDLVVHQPPEALALMDDFVRNMHTKSGLLPEIENATLSLEEAGAQTLAFLKEHIPDAGTVPLCGNSIGTDRRFLLAGLMANAPAKAGGHRALDDIQESLYELRYYRKHLINPR